jgi:hypothetical protein
MKALDHRRRYLGHLMLYLRTLYRTLSHFAVQLKTQPVDLLAPQDHNLGQVPDTLLSLATRSSRSMSRPEF